ncbi:MAG: hypothetical protein D6724_06625 [Armatimonadetes bacterium]|nr:MAG: hypothetical protein D6724_06625 [Armatimonadota bacterium]
MRLYDYSEPFEDEEMERRARDHYEKAREQGSVLPEARLMEECRKLAHEEAERLKATEDDPVTLEEEEV